MEVNSRMVPILETLLASRPKRGSGYDQPFVLMTCGLAGAGKTTFVKAFQAAHPGFHRLSTDEIVFQNHGIYGVDYEASSALYEQYQNEADEIYLSAFHTLLVEKKDVILERSFYAKEDRDEFRKIAQKAGAEVTLVYFKAEGEKGKNLLWERICRRNEGVKTANSSLDIDRETFEGYWNGFEGPDGEGEIVIDVV